MLTDPRTAVSSGVEVVGVQQPQTQQPGLRREGALGTGAGDGDSPGFWTSEVGPPENGAGSLPVPGHRAPCSERVL